MRNFKKIVAVCMAAISISSVLCIGASAETNETYHDWRAVGRNAPGAPSSVCSEEDSFSIYHNRTGAVATMSGLQNSIHGSVSTTVISCRNYAMEEVVIEGYPLNSFAVRPDVGSPLVDISVGYNIYVTTDTVGNQATSTGRLEKA